MLISDGQLTEILLRNNLLDEKKLVEIVEFAKNTEASFAEALIEKDILTDEDLGILISDFLKIPFVVLSKTIIPPEIFSIVPEKIARKQLAIPFSKDTNGIKLAMADPRNTLIQELVTKKTGQAVIPYLATKRDVENTLSIYRKDLQKGFEQLVKESAGQADTRDDAPILKIVDMIIDYAYQDKASDIHIEPEEKDTLIRFRIDGILHDLLVLPKNLHDRVITRIKVLSRLRTDEHLSAQDGKMRIALAEENLDIRVSILPISEGEKAVLRLLSSKSRHFSLIDLGMSEQDLKKVNLAIGKSFGMILSTGPTGSGKTTTVYSILKILNTRDKNITTIEDPVEYRIKGVNQIQVNAKTDLTFANGLRSILRQDPNIIFVGEIRDPETAGIAVNAALTGHLVLSTLHTNDSATALPRLIDMKVEPFLVASTVNVIIAQRLVRKICEMCKTSVTTTIEELSKNFSQEIIKKHFGTNQEVRIYKGQGCRLCHMTGYQGRVGVFEVLEVSKNIKKLITAKQDSEVIIKEAIAEGMTTMLDDGIDKVLKGVTTLEEVFRVTKVESL